MFKIIRKFEQEELLDLIEKVFFYFLTQLFILKINRFIKKPSHMNRPLLKK